MVTVYLIFVVVGVSLKIRQVSLWVSTCFHTRYLPDMDVSSPQTEHHHGFWPVMIDAFSHTSMILRYLREQHRMLQTTQCYGESRFRPVLVQCRNIVAQQLIALCKWRQTDRWNWTVLAPGGKTWFNTDQTWSSTIWTYTAEKPVSSSIPKPLVCFHILFHLFCQV